MTVLSCSVTRLAIQFGYAFPISTPVPYHRRVRRNNSVSDVGNTVDIANASYTNTIGDPVLVAHWEDPDFNPQQRAFYYVRVIEIPTPRWTAYDAKFFNIDMPDDIKMEVQDRAYTSPIWYTP